jgi:hypothetical protein
METLEGAATASDYGLNVLLWLRPRETPIPRNFSREGVYGEPAFPVGIVS